MPKRLIYAEDAIEALCKVGCKSGYCGISCDDVKAIEQLPPAQPQRMKGRWKLLPGRDDEHIRYLHCSVCHFNGEYESNFCPNCGADMR